MSKTKVMLYFEDNVSCKKPIDKDFINMVRSELSPEYDVSVDYGKIGTSKKKLFFSDNNPFNKESCIFPREMTRETNSKEITSKMPKLKQDEVPFFVIDTDGIEISNLINKILDINESGRQSKHPNHFISGIGELLPKLLENIYIKKIFSNSPRWGLVLVNSNLESSYIRSLNTNHRDFDDIIFEKPNSSSLQPLHNQDLSGNISQSKLLAMLGGSNHSKDGCYEFSNLGITYWNKGNYNQRFIGVNNRNSVNLIGYALQKNIVKIWKELLILKPGILTNSISSDISDYYQLIVDAIIDDHIYSKLENNEKYKNARDSVFSIYLKKRRVEKTTEGETIFSPNFNKRRLPHKKLKITNLGKSENFDIQYFHFDSAQNNIL